MSSAFKTNVDIGNRALQHCGASRMDPILGFSETSVNAAEVSSVYDKCRESELQANTWTFATKRTILRAVDTSTMMLNASLWSPATSYFRGSIVADQAGNLWESQITANLDNDPLLTSSYWQPYFGPLNVPLYDSSGQTLYFAGELVYTAAGDGSYRVYKSLISGNSDVPSVATAWSGTATYFKGQVATFNSVAYMSLIDLNTNNEPDLAPAAWASGTTYSSGQKVAGSDGMIYQSSANGNLGNDPTTDGAIHWTNTNVLAPWTTSFTGGTGSINWLEVGGAEFPGGVALIYQPPIYPVGAGPASQIATNNVFALPNSFLRQVPETPKQAVRLLGGPSGVTESDWLFENGLIVTRENGPLMLRFIADITDVRLMEPMFCEGLAARIALEICEKVTQSTAKMQILGKIYDAWIGKAKTVNAIEAGYVDPPDDEFLSVRA